MIDFFITLGIVVTLLIIGGALGAIIEKLDDILELSRQNYDLPARLELEARLEAEFIENQRLAEKLAQWNYDHDAWQRNLQDAQEEAGEIVSAERIIEK